MRRINFPFLDASNRDKPFLVSGQNVGLATAFPFLFKAAGGGAPVYDTDAQNYFDGIAANGSTIDNTGKTAFNNFVLSAKGDGFWSKLNFIAPYMGADLNGAKVAYRCDLGAVTNMIVNNFISTDYTQNGATGGLMGNGTTKYLQSTYLDNVQSSINASLGVYHNLINDALNDNKFALGTIDAGNNYFFIRTTQFTSDNLQFEIGGASTSTFPYGTGFIYATRTGNTLDKYVNGALKQTDTGAGATVFIGAECGLFCVNDDSPGSPHFVQQTNARQCFAFFGKGMNSVDASNLYSAVQALQIALGRNV